MEIQNGMLDACHGNHYNLLLGPVGIGRHALPDPTQLTDRIYRAARDLFARPAQPGDQLSLF